jgi:hypothetical protein
VKQILEIDKLTKAVLAEELRLRNQPITGNKDILAKRLLDSKYGNNSIDSHFLVTESPHWGRRTLGARIAPGGDWDDEYNYRCQESHELSLQVAGSAMPKDTARLGY